MSEVARCVKALRSAMRDESSDLASQLLYEHWLKFATWKARSEALPLIVGVDPAEWDTYLELDELAAIEQDVWASFSVGNGIAADDEVIPVSLVQAWCVANDVELLVSFTRLYDFIRQVVFQPSGSTSTRADGSADSIDDRDEVEIVLGAALSFVSKMPERCRDGNGFVDGTTVANLILDTTVRWFPSSPPSMSLEQMAELIDRWLE